jgi:diguanylate cyclase (GGDEF)-like protein
MGDEEVMTGHDSLRGSRTQEQDLSLAGLAAAPRSPCLLVIAGEAAGLVFPLTGQEVTLGRSQTCTFPLPDKGVSRVHARIGDYGNGMEIIDCGSTNGTFVNGDRIMRVTLDEGDQIRLGVTTVLKFTLQDELEECLQRSLYESAVKDGLTNIFNRKAFDERLEKNFSFFRRHEQPLSLLMFDIDLFKKINDTHGHPAGDYVLRTLASLVSPTVRKEDVFARFGGEEFAVLLTSCDAANALAFAERLRSIVESAEFVFEEKRIPVTISLGIATLQDRNFSLPREFLKAADDYLYLAKKNGRNRSESLMTAVG